ncbi:oligosaccharide MFS transporter [Paucilactobacillus kaifaensis]|uniref:oligosaccharide MFS transporter n=1 Tax=Paucilactobacillus kaifaensis TaxID=2559921 RepID=UPI0010F6DA0E|nr:oligosaccharide MFS transporter [Paucilactobacillus kaifaensis]
MDATNKNNNSSAPKKHFWSFFGTDVSYFFIWQIVQGFLVLWLKQEANLTGGQAGFVFSFLAFASLFYQPVFGIVSDKLVFKKNLLLSITCAAILIGPFFQWVFIPILHFNAVVGAVIGGFALAYVLNGGVAVIESYVERASLANGFEYGHSRMGGSIGGALASFVAGLVFVKNPFMVFWICSLAGIILTGLVLFGDKINFDNAKAAEGTSSAPLNRKTILSIFKIRNFWLLSIFFMGTSAIYDVFDQQFPVFYQTFFSSANAGTVAYSRLLTTQIALEAILMIPMPWIINKIGAKNGLIAYGVLTFLRITLSAIAPNFWFLTFVRLIASFEMPLFLVSTMKYIAGAFDLKLYATIYALAFNFAKQISLFIFSTVAGDLYDSIGFQHTYFVLAALVAVVTIIALVGMTKEDPVQAGEVKAPES